MGACSRLWRAEVWVIICEVADSLFYAVVVASVIGAAAIMGRAVCVVGETKQRLHVPNANKRVRTRKGASVFTFAFAFRFTSTLSGL